MGPSTSQPALSITAMKLPRAPPALCMWVPTSLLGVRKELLLCCGGTAAQGGWVLDLQRCSIWGHGWCGCIGGREGTQWAQGKNSRWVTGRKEVGDNERQQRTAMTKRYRSPLQLLLRSQQWLLRCAQLVVQNSQLLREKKENKRKEAHELWIPRSSTLQCLPAVPHRGEGSLPLPHFVPRPSAAGHGLVAELCPLGAAGPTHTGSHHILHNTVILHVPTGRVSDGMGSPVAVMLSVVMRTVQLRMRLNPSADCSKHDNEICLVHVFPGSFCHQGKHCGQTEGDGLFNRAYWGRTWML